MARKTDWGGIGTWLFDLDNTLYHPSVGLLDQMNGLMTRFIMDRLLVTEDEAHRLRRVYWERHGATLTGLVVEHGIEADDFLRASHRLDLSCLVHDAELAAAIRALPGRRIIHTNGPRHHAEQVLDALGIAEDFERVIALEDTGYVPKPIEDAHETAIRLAGIDAAITVMIEDTHPNLRHPATLGMTTVWLHHDRPRAGEDHIHHEADDLTGFLRGVTR